jgi:ribonuclease P protein component
MRFAVHFLKNKKDFQRILKSGYFYNAPYFKMKWLDNRLAIFRFGVVASLKVDKKAVVRNKLKRRMRAIFLDQATHLKPGYDFVIMFKPEAKKCDYHQLKEAMLIFFQKNRLLNK